MAIERQFSGTRPARPAPWRDPRVRALVYQALTLIVVVLLVAYFVDNTLTNLRSQGIAAGFGFLDRTAGFDISFSLIDYSAVSTYGRAFWVGLLNTLLVSALGVVLATILGFIIGLARLSTNWLVARLAMVYVETVRNIPLLLQLLFWYVAVLQALPHPRDSVAIGETVFLNNRGLTIPLAVLGEGIGATVIALVVALLAVVVLARWARRRHEATGQPFHTVLVSLGLLLGLPLLTFLALGAPVSFEYPEEGRFQLTGGLTLVPEFVALLTGLSIYTAAFIAEIVRAGIMSVSHGQIEAASALGPAPGADAALRGRAAGVARDHPAAHQPVSQPHQELLARRGDRLSGPGLDCRRHHAQPDRPGRRGDRHDHGGLSDAQPAHLAVHELVQPAHGAGGAMRHG